MLARTTTALRIEWRPIAALGDIVSEWRGLCARAAEPNVFYEPAFALAAAPVLGRDAGALLAWSAHGTLVGLCPLRVQRRRYGVPLSLISGWTHAYGPLGTPLIDRDHVDDVVAALFEHLTGDASLPKLTMLSYLPEDGAIAAALDAEIARRRLRQAFFHRHHRALLNPAPSTDDYLSAGLRKKRRHEFERQRRRLAEGGTLACDFESSPDRVDAALSEFLVLEASGWKGRSGTAAGLHPDIARFMATAVRDLAQEGKVLAACLRLDGRAIAAMIVIRSGTGAWGWKIAYDESLARWSPGVQVLLDLTKRLIDETDFAWADSCAEPGHSLMDHIWRERIALSDRLIATAPEAPFALACRLEALRRRAITFARDVRDSAERLGVYLR